MNLITELNQVIQYIEDNLDQELDIEDISRVTSYSPYHFQRIFNYISGIPLSEYIRKRRLSAAFYDLQAGEKVIDVAIKYGYLSADSFTRAFTKQHGMTPKQCKGETMSMELYPPMSFELSIHGTEGLSCRIEHKEAFNLFGLGICLTQDDKAMTDKMENFLLDCKKNGQYQAMNTIFGYDQDMMLHRAFQKKGKDKIIYILCQYMKDGVYVPDYFNRFYVPSGQWAIFHTESENMQYLWSRIQSEWLPNVGYELCEDRMAFEFYYGNEHKGKVCGEIMIPIKESTRKVYRNPKQIHRLKKEEDYTMNGNYHIEEFVYADSYNEPLSHLYEEVTAKYPNGIYWSYDPNSNEGKHMFLCLNHENEIIGKGHVMIYEKQEDDAPGYAEHRLFMHYRFLPEYEQDEEAVKLLYERLFQCACELRKTLSNRACQLCIGNHDFETIYNEQIEKMGWPEYGSIYDLSVETRESEHLITEIEGTHLQEFSLDSIETMRQLTAMEQVCFRDSIASLDNYIELSKENYRAYGAFTKDKDGVDTIVGAVLVTLEDGELGNIPEITEVMVLPEYQRKHIAQNLIEMTLNSLRKQGYENAWLVTPCTNKQAIALYEKLGFKIFGHEKRYMKYL